MQGDIVPVRSEIDGDVDRPQQRPRVPRVPEGVAGRMLDGRRAPEFAERMLGIVGVDHVLEHGDDGLAVEVLHSRVDRRDAEHVADEVDAPASPERIRLLRQHADCGQPGRNEAGVEQAVVPDRVVEVVGRQQRRDRLEMRRLRRRRRELSHGEVADAEHADIAVAPGLGRDPFDEVVKILPLLPVEQGPAPPEPLVPRALTMRWT